MSDTQTLATWRSWLRTIFGDVQRLLIRQHIYSEVRAIIKSNSAVQMGSSFYSWMNDVYVDSMVIGIRRQVDTDRRTVSLLRLLDAIRLRPGILTRRRYVEMVLGSRIGKGADNLAELKTSLANVEFDRWAGKGGSHVDPRRPAQEISDLKAAAEAVADFANARVAHHKSEYRPTQLPLHRELKSCLELMEEVIKSYCVILEGTSYTGMLPTWQYDWKAIFREPWIPAGK